MINGAPVVALLLVGGAGTRLWPISNEASPKQFLRLFDDRSLFQASLSRIAGAGVDQIAVITGAGYRSTVLEQTDALGLLRPHLLLEPCRRDSAAAISAGVAWVRQEIGPNAVVAVFPADHYIRDVEAFSRAVQHGADLATAGWLVTFGIRPTLPTTEYGYIQRGASLAAAGFDFAHRVVKFHEKPKRDVAEAYLRDGSYDWNSGIFLFGAAQFAEQAHHHMTDVWEPAQRAVELADSDSGALALEVRSFVSARKSSIDHALFEKSDRVAVIPVSFEWHDIGNWGSAYDAFRSEPGANVRAGDTVLDQVSGSLVISDGVKVVLCGLQDVIVVASPQGTFVAPRSKAAEIKRLLGT